MQVDFKYAGQFIECNDNSIRVFNQCLVRKYAVQIYFKNIFYFQFGFLILKKKNPRNLYLRMLVGIAESLYSRGGAPISGSASAYVRSGSASISVSGSELTISPMINLI